MTLLRRLPGLLLWLGVGATVAGVVGMSLGVASRAWLPLAAGIVAIIAACCLMFALPARHGSVRDLARRVPDETADPGGVREIARIEEVRDVGISVGGLHHLFEFTVTVVGPDGPARQEDFAQFITLGQLPDYATGRYVVLGRVASSPKRLLIDRNPPPPWGQAVRDAPARYDGITPVGGAASERGAASAPERTSRRPGFLTRVLIPALCAVLELAGGLVHVYRSPELAVVELREIPQRASGEVSGYWDSDQLPLALDDLSAASPTGTS